MSRFKGVIFDIDGTLLDSNDAHARAWEVALREQGVPHPFSEIRALMGMGGDQLVKHLVGWEKEDPRSKAAGEAWKKHFQAHEQSAISGQPGAHELLVDLKQRGFKLIVGTSADGALVDGLLEKINAKELLAERTTASDVAASKPEPDIVQAAVKKLGLNANEVVMVGDTTFDIQAARKAGVGTIFLRCGGDARSEDAIAVYDSPLDLLNRLADSPLA